MASAGPTDLTQKSASPGRSRSGTAATRARRVPLAAGRGRAVPSALQPAAAPTADAATPRNVRRCSPLPVTFVPFPLRSPADSADDTENRAEAAAPRPDTGGDRSGWGGLS